MNEDWNKPMDKAMMLLSKRRHDEALRVLEEARDHYVASEDLETASFYSNLAGACLASQGRDLEALSAYETAERLDSRSAGNKLATANHLLRMSRPEAARSKAGEALQATEDNNYLKHFVLAIRGMADLELNRQSSAIQDFHELSRPEVLQELHASSCDLRLVDRLLKARLERRACEEYLLEVNRKAELEEDLLTLKTVSRILGEVS